MDLNKRLYSLDVMRGADIALMIIVNTPGDGDMTFSPLHHAKWLGFTLTDLVFPTFLFIAGTSMAFTLPSLSQQGTGTLMKKVLQRTAIIFLLGFLMYWFPFVMQDASGEWVFRPISTTRIFGVLQRIALCYGAAALVIHFLRDRGALWFSIAALLGYWWLLTAFGDLTLEGNVVLRFDRWLIGDAHLYMGEGVPFDPEGLLSTLPAIVNVVAGYLAGRWIIRKQASFETVSVLMLLGAVITFIALGWDLIFPFSKKLWTSSFTLYTIGLDLMILGSCVYLIDILKFRTGANFFVVMGRNPIVVYLISELLAILLYTFHVGEFSWFRLAYLNLFSWLPNYFASLAFAIAFMLVCWLAGYWMDRKKWYVRV